MGDDQTRRAFLGHGLTVSLDLGLGMGFVGAGAAAQTAQDFVSADRSNNRLTASVRIGDGPPMQFAIDTAANSSVIASDLLDHVDHRATGLIVMHTLVGAETVETIRVRRLRSGVLDLSEVRMAVGSREGLEGLDGLLGSEILLGRRLVLDFKRRVEARIVGSRVRTPSRLLSPEPGARLITPLERRFRSLLMISAKLGAGVEATAIVDSGAAMTMMNEAAALAGGAQPMTTAMGQMITSIQSPTGRTTPARLALLPSLGFAEARVGRLPVLVGDFHTFSQWGLSDQPAVLLGVDVLGLFESVSIDLKRREFIVTF